MTVLLFCVVFICFWVSSQAQNLGCHEIDLNSLWDFSVQLDPRISDWDFDSGNCCNWSGIKCNNSSRVARLELGNRELIGNISESLGSMEQLVVLNLSHNYLHGSISNRILHFPNLEVLDLSSNFLNGSFPSTMNLPSLKIFNVSMNRISGPVPVGICINSSNISVLDLTDNHFGGALHPEVGNCTSLKELRIASNSVTGELPENLFLLHNLEDLYLQENRFSGQLSNSIGSLSKLVNLDLSLNNFSGHLPDVFDRFEQLGYFSAHSNLLTGRMPDSLVNSQTITSLALRNNSLNGIININCSAMVRLVSLNLATNGFHGPIPETLSDCPQLRTINFARINFSGQVPESFKNFSSLSSISLSNSSISNLTGALEIFQNCPNLTTLILTLNFKGENISASNSFHFPRLRVFVVANCGLHGAIPEWLIGCRKLRLLDLSLNKFSGSIPPWFGNMSFLFYLDLSNNRLVGQIPKELTEMQSFINDTISLEEASPDFPFFVRRNLTATGFKYRQVISFPPTLSLGNNHLNGSIWPEFGNLKELHVLDLNHNNLSGPIPSNLSEMRSLETLDLSYNNLSGSIPPSLVSLTFLSKFNVAHNFLSGQIPAGPQFFTFPNSSFFGNQGLCGDHGLPPCATTSTDAAPKSNRLKAIAMGIGIGLGSAIFISLICFVVVRSCNLKDTVPRDSGSDDTDIEELSSVAILCQDKNSASEMYFGELLRATNSFDQSNIIGCGGFGFVYKAVLSDGRKVAIKRLTGEHFQMEREFRAEIETLSRAQHPNLVRLQGYCKYREDRLLIYTYMENGSLDYWLHENPEGPSELHWKRRLEIAKGAARGLAYLHLCCEPHIIHRDIKSSNILLNERFEAHLADFGLARLILPFATHVSTDLVGTLGYIPPEYGLASVATYKGDVYSFGVVLLEILTGKRPMDICRPKGCRNLVEWVGGMKEEKREAKVFDSVIFEKQYVDEMMKVLDIAWACLNDNPRLRPSIEELLSLLVQVDL